MSRECMIEFIKTYESEPCLWQISLKDYHDRNKKEAGYAKLAEKLKPIEPNATKDSVIKKINNLRSAYRKEKKKIKESLKSGATGDLVYKPKLWYFSLLNFLWDKDANRTATRSDTDDSEDDSNSVDRKYTGETDGQTEDESTPQSGSSTVPYATRPESSSTSRCFHHPQRKRSFQAASEQDPFQSDVVPHNNVVAEDNCSSRRPTPHFFEDADRFDLFGKSVAIKMRGLPKRQMLIAEKIINETLFLAETGISDLSHLLNTYNTESPCTLTSPVSNRNMPT